MFEIFNGTLEPTIESLQCASRVVKSMEGNFQSEDARVAEFLTATNPSISWTKTEETNLKGCYDFELVKVQMVLLKPTYIIWIATVRL